MDHDITAVRGEARHDKAIYLCCDTRFFPYALFLIDQIAGRTPARDFDLVLLSSEPLPDHDLLRRHDVRVVQMRLDADALALPTNARIPLAAYLRIFAPDIFANDYRRLLYLDADIFYQRGDLSRLLDIDMQGLPVGGVRDLPQMRKHWRKTEDFQKMGLPHSKYFNSGMILIDVAAWRGREVTRKALEIAARYGDKLSFHDQSALNGVLQGDWLELNPVWNFAYSHQTCYFSAMFDVCLYHFIGRRKPFMGSYGGFPHRFTEPYRRFFAAHFPALVETVQDGLQSQQRWHLHSLVLLIHAVYARKFLHNEGYWRSDWDTRTGKL